MKARLYPLLRRLETQGLLASDGAKRKSATSVSTASPPTQANSETTGRGVEEHQRIPRRNSLGEFLMEMIDRYLQAVKSHSRRHSGTTS